MIVLSLTRPREAVQKERKVMGLGVESGSREPAIGESTGAGPAQWLT
ncbi:hypothetical protein HMPREF9061_00631 [Actinomyces sp. oral taxon 181 str. F0379]|nr:hypothetical protein HMPREF9061_00631 [Actinomyces sp. oral taxon 181 str. F0379]